MVCKPRMKRANLLTPQVVCLVSLFSSIAASARTWFVVFFFFSSGELHRCVAAVPGGAQSVRGAG